VKNYQIDFTKNN